MQIKQMHYSFDFDYTLADSSSGAILCFNYALEKLGLPEQPESKIRKTIGLSLLLTIFTTIAFAEGYDDPFTEGINEGAW